MKQWPKYIMLISAGLLCIVSYGFIDPHLSFSQAPIYRAMQEMLVAFVYHNSIVAAGVCAMIIGMMFLAYSRLYQSDRLKRRSPIPSWIMALVGLLLLSYPAFSYDIFNYMATAKVTFQYQENPYVIMPIEIPNEPMLSYTRAANKLALYGPTWIAFTVFPYLAGLGNPFMTILSFKLLTGIFYVSVAALIFHKTKRWDQTLWFALHPLVLIEVLGNGHNDIVMMALAIAGIFLWQRESYRFKIVGLILWIASVCVKGATIMLFPLFLLPLKDTGKIAMAGFWLMFMVFLVTPLREEMYPWYAVWWISFAAFIPLKKQSFIHGFSYWFGFGLMLRYLPWIATREYGGITPISRIILMLIPVTVYVFTILMRVNRTRTVRRKLT